MSYIGISKGGRVTENTVLGILNEACASNSILEMNVDFSKDFETKRVNVNGEYYDFIEVHLDNEPIVIENIVKGVLMMGIPCYRGDVYYHTIYPPVFEKGIILHAPDEQGNVHGGISVVRAYIDVQCGIEFPIKSFEDTEPVILFYPLSISLPMTYAGFMNAAQKHVTRKNLNESEKKKHVENWLVKVSAACALYGSDVIWEHDAPQPIVDIMKSTSFLTQYNTTKLMKPDDLAWLGISAPADPGTPAPMELQDLTPMFNFFDQFMSMETNEDVNSVFSSAVSSYLNSNLKGKRVRFNRNGNKFVFEIADEDDEEGSTPLEMRPTSPAPRIVFLDDDIDLED